MYTTILTKYDVEFVTGGEVTADSVGEYPKLTSDALQEVAAEPTPGFCPSWGNGDADATGDVYHVRLANAPAMGAYMVQSFGMGEPVAPTPFAVQVTSRAPFKFVEANDAAPGGRSKALTAGVPFAYYLQIVDGPPNDPLTNLVGQQVRPSWFWCCCECCCG